MIASNANVIIMLEAGLKIGHSLFWPLSMTLSTQCPTKKKWYVKSWLVDIADPKSFACKIIARLVFLVDFQP
jgi:hypothetical protein